MRLDLILVEKGLYDSREKAKQAIEGGRVFVNGVLATKPSKNYDENIKIEARPFEYVSRGGFKLEKALAEFKINLQGKLVLDIGASTGGFTDVCLQNGARKVYAVDTGEGQLAESLQKNARVVNLQKTNFLTLDKSFFEDAEVVVIDVSFVSLTYFAEKLSKDFDKIEIVALIKPQFEVGLNYARKHGGVVKDEKMHKKVIDKVVACFKSFGFECKRVIESPIKGGDGNTEFLAHIIK